MENSHEIETLRKYLDQNKTSLGIIGFTTAITLINDTNTDNILISILSIVVLGINTIILIDLWTTFDSRNKNYSLELFQELLTILTFFMSVGLSLNAYNFIRSILMKVESDTKDLLSYTFVIFITFYILSKLADFSAIVGYKKTIKLLFNNIYFRLQVVLLLLSFIFAILLVSR